MTATASFDVADGMRIALVGGGKMGEAIMGGWIGAHEAPADVLGPENFVVANPGGERRSFLQERYGVACVDDARRIELTARTGQDAETTRVAVCSPGGSTLAALAAMEEAGFAPAIAAGLSAAVRRSKELGQC